MGEMASLFKTFAYLLRNKQLNTEEMSCSTPFSPAALAVRHPLAPLVPQEFEVARKAVHEARGADTVIYFREIFLQEPLKKDLVPYLEVERAGASPQELLKIKPRRWARVQYDTISEGKSWYTQSVIDLMDGKELQVVVAEPHQQTAFTLDEYNEFTDAVNKSDLFKAALEEFVIPPQFKLMIDPWPYGGPEDSDGVLPRLMQGLVYCQDTTTGNPDSNYYSYPVPLIPVIDWTTKKVIRVDRLSLALDRHGWVVDPKTQKKTLPLFSHGSPAEYCPELLPSDVKPRDDLKPINITQPEGTSFAVTPDGLITWQKWRLRLSFTPREGAVLYDVSYDGRPILFRMSFSEMTVPYGDPRNPYHRKQAFDFGDGGIGRAANNLRLGCDCVGAIHYVSTLLSKSDGKPETSENVVCLHEQDNGIGWKHTNFRTNRPVVTRLREFVIQFIVTLANYEYVFAYKLDVSGNIGVEIRATGMISVAPIDESIKTAPYGVVVAPGALAQNHQHIFALRIDPAIDGYALGVTQVIVEETHAEPTRTGINTAGNYFSVRKRVVEKAEAFDAAPQFNREVRMENPKVVNKVSGRNVGFKFAPLATQLMLADPQSRQAKRAKFAKHHIWVVGHRDGELWAAGEYTNMSTEEKGGLWDQCERGDWFIPREGEKEKGKTTVNAYGLTPQDEQEARLSWPVVWSVFGLTHNPRMEDWPVMPTEIHSFQIRPADFFEYNPALDVPPVKNPTSVLVPVTAESTSGCSSCK